MTTLAQGQASSAGTATPSPLSIRPRPRAAMADAGRATSMADSGRATARAVLDDALRGIELTAIDRRFVSRLSQWDKRNATTVAALIARARQAGRGEAQSGVTEAQIGETQTGETQTGETLTPEQLETVLAALTDAFAYRTCGASAAGCWDCANRARGLCAEHAKDADRAHAFAEFAAALSGSVTLSASAASVTSDASVAQTAVTSVTAVTSAAQTSPVTSVAPKARPRPVPAAASVTPVTPTALSGYRRRAAVAS